jgi:hypothetical protein
VTFAILFWMLLIVGVLLHGWGYYAPNRPLWPGSLLVFVLLVLLGLKVFGGIS